MKERIRYIDIAKGILIILMIWGHLDQLQLQSTFKNEFLGWTSTLCRYYNPFYLAAFFFITGYCSDFSKTSHEFLKGCAKGLLIPNICLSIIVGVSEMVFIPDSGKTISLLFENNILYGGYWFLMALLEAKIVCYYVLKIHKIFQAILIGGLYMVACLLIIHNQHTPNYLYWLHTFILLPFLYMGTLLKKKMEMIMRRYIVIIAFLFYLISCIVFVGLRGISMPFVNGGFIMISYKSLFIYPLLVLSGTIIVLSISRWIKKSKILEFIGQQTLSIYCLHYLLLQFFYSVFGLSFFKADLLHSIFATFLMLLSCGSLYLILYKILDTKYLRFLIGR